MKKKVIERLVTLITAAFGLIAALAWNEAIQSIFKGFFKEREGIIAKIIYALIITIIVVIVTIWISKLKPEE